jgi:hypothetical protein
MGLGWIWDSSGASKQILSRRPSEELSVSHICTTPILELSQIPQLFQV